MDSAAEAAARDPICWSDLVVLRRGGAPDARGVLMKPMPRNMLGVMRADGAMVAARWRDLTAVDRSYFRQGHVVAAASDPGGQIGVVTGVETALDVARSDGGGRKRTTVARGVSPAGLRRVTEPSLGDYVVSGHWLRGQQVPDRRRRHRQLHLLPGAACRRLPVVVSLQGLSMDQGPLEAQSRHGHRRQSGHGRRGRLLARLPAAGHLQGPRPGVGAPGVPAEPAQTGNLPFHCRRIERVVCRRPLLLSNPSRRPQA
ncbi:unnamed protein product [Urochloa humidicola]